MSHTVSTVSVARAGADDADRVLALFEASDAPCYCQFPQFPGDNREWQLRCGERSDENRAALSRDLETGQVNAWIAYAEERVVGWMRMEPTDRLQKIYQGRLYRGLPCFDGTRSQVFGISCFLVDPRERRSGVARALLSAGISWARGEGARAVEAFPRGADDVTDEEQFRGPLSLYQTLGFRIVHDFAPYPVLRLQL